MLFMLGVSCRAQHQGPSYRINKSLGTVAAAHCRNQGMMDANHSSSAVGASACGRCKSLCMGCWRLHIHSTKPPALIRTFSHHFSPPEPRIPAAATDCLHGPYSDDAHAHIHALLHPQLSGIVDVPVGVLLLWRGHPSLPASSLNLRQQMSCWQNEWRGRALDTAATHGCIH